MKEQDRPLLRSVGQSNPTRTKRAVRRRAPLGQRVDQVTLALAKRNWLDRERLERERDHAGVVAAQACESGDREGMKRAWMRKVHADARLRALVSERECLVPLVRQMARRARPKPSLSIRPPRSRDVACKRVAMPTTRQRASHSGSHSATRTRTPAAKDGDPPGEPEAPGRCPSGAPVLVKTRRGTWSVRSTGRRGGFVDDSALRGMVRGGGECWGWSA